MSTKIVLALPAAFLAAATILLAGSPAALAAGKGRAKPLDLTNHDDLFQVQVKASCSTVSGKPTLYWWSGRMWGRVPGEADKLLFNVHGMNVRRCEVKSDPKKGLCYHSVSREVMFYMDPVTNEVVREWQNPWTGETVPVVHVANDPVNMRPNLWFCARDEEGKPINRDSMMLKDDVILEGGSAARLFYKNPLAGDYQDYVGGMYHAMEFGTTAIPVASARNSAITEFSDSVISWGRISRWLPWMKMGDRDGLVVFHTAGMRLDNFEQMPEVVRREIDSNYPQYREPPPLDDTRPNETSWTVFKKYIDSKKAAETKSN
jgi:hypothetical protein